MMNICEHAENLISTLNENKEEAKAKKQMEGGERCCV